MIYVVYEFEEKDRVTQCNSPAEANEMLDRVLKINKGGKPLGYVDSNGEIHLASIYPTLPGQDRALFQAELNLRIKKAAKSYIEELSYGRG